MAWVGKTTFAGLKLEFAPGIGAKTVPTALQWVDITNRLRSFVTDRGRKTNAEQFPAGTMTVVLDNLDRELDPDYASSTYAGDLVPNVQMRLTGTYVSPSTSEVLFYGFIEAWPQSYPGQDADLLVTLVASDALSILATTKLPGSVWEYTIRSAGPSAWFRLGEKSGTVAGDASGNGQHGTYNAAVVAAQQAIVPYAGPDDGSLQFDGIDDFLSVSVPVLDMSDTTCSVEFWMKTDMVPTNGGALLVKVLKAATALDTFFVKMASDGTLRTTALFGGMNAGTSIALNDNKVHHVVLSQSAGNGTIYVDGANVTVGVSGSLSVWNTEGTFIGSEPSAAFGGSIDEPFQGFLDEIVFWNTALSASDVTDHYEAGTNPWEGQTSGERVAAVLDVIGWPSGARDIDTGESILGPAVFGGTALDYLRSVEATEAGWLFVAADGAITFVGRANQLAEAIYSTPQATFGDASGEMKYHDITLEPGHIRDVVNTARVSRRGGVEQVYTDTTSADLYGDQDLALSGLLMNSDSAAQGRATAEVLLRKDPRSRISEMVIMPGRDGANLFPKVLAYDIGTRLTGKRRPQGTTAITKEIHLAGIRHEGRAGDLHWVTTWATTPVDPNEDDWCLVDSGIVDTSLVSY